MAVFPVNNSVISTVVASLLSILTSLFPAAPLQGQEPQVVEQQSATETPLFFESRVRGILKEHCWHCHGEEADLRGNLDTRLVRQMLTGGDSGPAIEPGNHAESLLYQRMLDGEMPPGDSHLSPAELQAVADWINAGAKTQTSEPESAEPGLLISDADRLHWSFRPIQRPPVPETSDAHQQRGPVDAFIARRLDDAGLSFSPRADRTTLLRRVWLDLAGLPPSPEEIDRFLSDESPEAWNTVIDDLLKSPAYGERWARHWLDIVGYADSDGYTQKDPERPWSWKYRDYIIRSLNADKPLDQFITEQLAGDELLPQPLQNLTTEQADLLIATGFLRMTPDGTGAGAADQPLARNDAISASLRTASESLLGLTIGCAQCHEHRYDPISQEDYYRLRAIMEPAWNTEAWRAPNARLISMWSAETKATADSVKKELAVVTEQRNSELDDLVEQTFERELKKLPEQRHEAAREARRTPAKERTEPQLALIREFPFLNVSRGSVYLYLPDRLRGFNKKWDDLTAEVKAKLPADDYVMCLTEIPGKVPPTHLFARGDHLQPRQQIPPGVPTVLNPDGFEIAPDNPDLPTSGRRLAWAKRLTGGSHPLLARVLVNRIWMHHFGQGLVRTPSDFGLKGDRPSHPELLDWLAAELMENGWSLKHIHRLILKSAVWQQQSIRTAEQEQTDPENRLLARMNVRRLEAEVVRDAVLSLSGSLNREMYGKPIPVAPDDVGQIVLGKDNRDSAGRPKGNIGSLGESENRRSIYVQVRRSMPLGVLEPFDLPRMEPSCQRRDSSTTAPQSLLMLNHPFISQQAALLAERLKAYSTEQSEQMQLGWKLVFGRQMTAAEQESANEFLNSPESDESAMTLWCHALLCSSEFLYVL